MIKVILKEDLKKGQEIELSQEIINMYPGFFEVKNKGRWKPKGGTSYYFISPYGKPEELIYVLACESDKLNISMGNCYKTKEQAQAMVDRIKFANELIDDYGFVENKKGYRFYDGVYHYHDTFCKDEYIYQKTGLYLNYDIPDDKRQKMIDLIKKSEGIED